MCSGCNRFGSKSEKRRIFRGFIKSITIYMKILILLFLLCLLLTQYKVKDGFDNQDSLNKAIKYVNDEMKETTDPERRQKLQNATNYIYFIKTLFN
jgi:hypothetical protein